MQISIFSTKPYDQEYFSRYNTEHDLQFFQANLKQGTLNLVSGAEGVCVFVNDQLDKLVIKGLAKKGVKLIALRCAGFNNVDLEACKAHDIKVVRVPAYSPYAVAEHALALIMGLNRKTHKAYNRVREGNFSLERLTGFDLFGKTVGVIGTGKIGAVFCRIMLGLGCKVLAYDIHPNEKLQRAGVIYKELPAIFSESDIISLHCPLNEHTHHIINDAAIIQMKKGVMLINSSRGGLVDTKAVIHGLKHRKIGYLGIDVYEQEEQLFFEDLSETIIDDDQIARLMSFPNVLVTAHQAFFTEEALTQIAQTTLANISAFESGEALENEVKA
ncbi:MAG: 2-hydroxyacid dehydrogenase [Bacteroidota bacterium]